MAIPSEQIEFSIHSNVWRFVLEKIRMNLFHTGGEEADS